MAAEQEREVLYLAPSASKLTKWKTSALPPIPQNATRVVTISDTHNEHQSIPLPWGHVLLHAGDVLTESGKRYVSRRRDGSITGVDERGPILFDRFAHWLSQQPHPHKAIIGGNHDLVLQSIGPDGVRKVLDKYCSPGSATYLEHEEAKVGPLKIFGSPFAHWGGGNDAFMSVDSVFDESPLSPNTHILLTHSPPILPHGDKVKETKSVTRAMHNANVLLSVSGHCHWAHGLYMTERGSIPCVVSSICDSKWLPWRELKAGPSGERGDPRDKHYGGYNLRFPVIVADLLIPGGAPLATDKWKIGSLGDSLRGSLESLTSSGNGFPSEDNEKPALLFFGPDTDTHAVIRLTPLLSENYQVFHFDEADEAVDFIKERPPHLKPFRACVSKLGSRGNLGRDVIKALREKYGSGVFVVVHSATAKGNKGTQQRFVEGAGPVDLFVGHRDEDAMLASLASLVSQ